MNCPPCSGDCNQGRACTASLNITRALFALPPKCDPQRDVCSGDPDCHAQLCAGHPLMEGVPMPFYQADGGHSYHRGVVFPIARELADEPLASPESTAEDALAWAAAIAVAALAIACAVALAFGAPSSILLF